MIIRFEERLSYPFQSKDFNSVLGFIGVYFIYLEKLSIPYPFSNSRLIYIGMSESKANSIGKRLKDHSAGRSNNRGIIGYQERWELGFTYLDYEFLKHVFPTWNVELIETNFLEKFSEDFGSYPICNNRKGELNKLHSYKGNPTIDWDFFKD